MLELVLQSFIISIIVTFLLSFFYKIGLMDFLQIHTYGNLNKLFNCMFCLSFWLTLILVICLLLITGSFVWFAIFLSPVLNRLMF